jgi:single-stranded DNA-binding protein
MEFWDSLAEIAGHHLKKGDQVYVTGRLMVDTFMKGDVNQRTARVSNWLSGVAGPYFRMCHVWLESEFM